MQRNNRAKKNRAKKIAQKLGSILAERPGHLIKLKISAQKFHLEFLAPNF